MSIHEVPGSPQPSETAASTTEPASEGSAGEAKPVSDVAPASNFPSSQGSEIEERFLTLLANELKKDKAEISRDSKFQEDLGMDSLDLTELVMKIEDEFKISVKDEDYEKLGTVGEASDYIAATVAAGNTAQ